MKLLSHVHHRTWSGCNSVTLNTSISVCSFLISKSFYGLCHIVAELNLAFFCVALQIRSNPSKLESRKILRNKTAVRLQSVILGPWEYFAHFLSVSKFEYRYYKAFRANGYLVQHDMKSRDISPAMIYGLWAMNCSFEFENWGSHIWKKKKFPRVWIGFSGQWRMQSGRDAVWYSISRRRTHGLSVFEAVCNLCQIVVKISNICI